MLNSLKKNWFLFGILTALLLGFFFPNLGIALNPASITRTILLVLLFLISGFTLPTETIRRGLSDWPLHLYIQSFVFVVLPAFFVLTTLPFKNVWPEELRIGIFALACIPTTISSCIVFTQISGGNVMGTMFNASLANIMGIIVSPLLLSLLLRGTGQPLPASEVLKVLRNLGLIMSVPIACGQLLRHFFKEIALRHKTRLGILSNLFILIIVFFSFSRTASNPDFLHTVRRMISPFAYLAVSHLVLLLAAFSGARLLRFSRENTISAVYAAPQKTLAVGIPLISTYFSSRPEILGLSLLPLLFYHAWQLFCAGIVKNILATSLKNRSMR